MTKNQIRSLAVLCIVAIFLGALVFVLSRTRVLFAPVGDRALSQPVGKKTSGLMAIAEAEYAGISKLNIGMTEDAFKGLRPKAVLDVGIDEMQGRNKTSHSEEFVYAEKEHVQGANERLNADMWNLYGFREGRLFHFEMQWYLPSEEVVPLATMTVKHTRERYGKEDEQIIRNWRQPNPGSPPNPCPELLWHRGSNTVIVRVVTFSERDSYILFMVCEDAYSKEIPTDIIRPVIPVSDEEKRQVLEKHGIPPL